MPPRAILVTEPCSAWTRACRRGKRFSHKTKTPWPQGQGVLVWQNCSGLEQIPEELVVDVVVILHLGRLHEGSEQTRTAVGGGLFQVGVTAFYVFA